MHQEGTKNRRRASGATTNAAGETRSFLTEESDLLVGGIDLLRSLTGPNMRGLGEGISIRSALGILTNKKKESNLIKRISPESGFHHNRNAVARLVECLRYWTQQERILSPEHSLGKALMIFDERLSQNIYMLTRE